MPTLLNIQTSSSELSNPIRSEAATNPLLFLNCNYNLQKHIKMCCGIFNKISVTRKNSAARKFWHNDKFWLFWPNHFGVAHGISVKFGLWTFHKLLKRQKKIDFTAFWLPYLLPSIFCVVKRTQPAYLCLYCSHYFSVSLFNHCKKISKRT